MKAIFNISAVAWLLAAVQSPCFALWGLDEVTQERAKEMGIEVRSAKAGPNHLRVEMEFKTDGALKNYAEGSLKDHSRVELRVGLEDNPPVTAALREDRSKPGRVAVSFIADRGELDRISLWIMIPAPLGGTAYMVQMKNFVESAPRP
jgi:hypothetical protein